MLLGNPLNQSRCYRDFGMIWSVVATMVMLPVIFNQALLWAQRRVLTRMGMAVFEQSIRRYLSLPCNARPATCERP